MIKQLYILCNAGLANRIHAWAGATLIANQTQRRLKVWWPCNHHLNARFSKLFKNHVDFVHHEEIEALLTTEHRVKVYNCGFDPENTSTRECYSVDPKDEDDIVVIKSWWVPTFKDQSMASVMPYVVRLLRNLEPTDEVMDLVKGFPFFHNPFVGLHVRFGDQLKDKPGQWDAEVVKLYEKSNIAAFDAAMQRILAVKPNTRFFVSSINSDVEKDFYNRYGPNRIIFQHKNSLGRNSVVGMREALADMILLSKCRFLIGSDYSQFSSAASEIGCIPMIRAGVGDWLEQLDKLIPTL